MRKRSAVLISLVIIAVLGFYTGKTVLPGIYGHGAGMIVPPGSAQGDSPSIETPPIEPSIPATGGKETYWIDVDVTAQKVKIMQGDQEVKTMTASTGVEGHETPLGTFQIQNRGDWFFNEKYQQGAKYWVSFRDWGIYLFHSVAMDEKQEVIPEEEVRLGEPASHGCIRLPIVDAKWIYDNIPEQTKVVIHT